MRKRKNRYMSKADFDQMFKDEYIPMILRVEMKQGSTYPDAPLRRETYNNAIDSFSKDGQIRSSQAYNWSHPSWLETYGFRKALAEKRKRDRYGYSNPRKRKNSPKGLTENQMLDLLDTKGYQTEYFEDHPNLVRENASNEGYLQKKDGLFYRDNATNFPSRYRKKKRKSNPRKNFHHNPRKRRNGYESDDAAIREVLLTVENDHGFYEMVLKPAAKNMAIKQYKGKFNKTLALKMYKHVADKADKFYAWTYGDRTKGARYWLSQKGFMLSADDRRKLAAELLDSNMDLIEGYLKDLKSGVKQRSLKNPRRRR